MGVLAFKNAFAPSLGMSICLLSAGSPAWSQDSVNLSRTDKSIADLLWLKTDIPLIADIDSYTGYGTMIIEGKFNRQYWELGIAQDRIRRTPEGRFALRVQVKGPENPVTLFAVGPRGEVEYEKIELKFPTPSSWTQWKTRMTALKASSRIWSFTLGSGITSQSYSQPGMSDFSQLGITLKGTVNYILLRNHWTLSANIFGTALPLSSSLPGVTYRALGGNFRADYLLAPGSLGLDPAWRLGMSSGFYFSTTFVTNDAFGYSDLFGPQIFPTVTRLMKDRTSITAYFKFAPISSGFALANLSSHELAAGLTYRWKSSDLRALPGVGFDYVVDRIQITPDTAARSKSLTLSVFLGL